MYTSAADVAPLSGHWLIVSDLDGTLLDHYTYAHDAADSVLKRLEQAGIPVVCNTSKTYSEMIALRQSLGNTHPFIVENGSAIYIPENYFADEPIGAEQWDDFWVISLGAKCSEIREFLEEDASMHGRPYMSFAHATDDEIMAATGLSEGQVAQAHRRDYSEALLWQGNETEKAAFEERVRAAGYRTLQGGRFLHVLGQTGKGAASLTLLCEYQRQGKRNCRLLAAGDSPNDIEMLSVADVAVLIRSPVHEPPSVNHDRLILSSETGPAGWARIMETLFPTI